MTSKTITTQYSGVGFSGLLTILFIGLKLGNVIHWSWWWVLSPLWITFAVCAVIFLLALVYYATREFSR